MTEQITWKFLEDYTIKKSETSDIPLWVNLGLVENLPRLVSSIKINNIIEGYVGVLFYERKHRDFHVKLVELICQTIAIEMQNIIHPQRPKYSITTSFIKNLFEGKNITKEELSRWTSSMNLKISPGFCVAVVGGTEQENTKLHYLRNVLEKDSLDISCTVLDSKLYILFNNLGNHTTDEDFMKSKIRRLANILHTYNIKAGTSIIFNNLLHISNYRYQADRALQIGSQCIENKTVYSYKDYVLQNMMSYVRKSIEPINYLHPALEILRNHDEKNGTEYFKTLKVYILSMCNHSNSTKKLHIHRNTLLYRLNKIQELTGTSLSDERFCALLLCDFYLIDN